jgi:diguanylate cyclase (GGDEF)-like protein
MPTVLIVSHDAKMIYELRRALEQAGVRAIGSSSQFEAQQIATTTRVDVLLVDREIGADRGAALCDQIRTLHGDAAPAMLIMDRRYSPAVLASALAAGTAGVVSKSDPINQVADRVLSLVKSRPGTARLEPDSDHARRRDTDPLTGLTDRRYFERRLQGEWAFACNQRAPMAIVMLSPDQLGELRATSGEIAAARMLSTTARVIEGQLRSRDCVSRFDRDTFAVIMSDTPAASAQKRALGLARALEQIQYGTVDEPIGATFSVGLAATADPLATGPHDLVRDSFDEVRMEQTAKLAQGKPLPSAA